jgi:glutathione S-transferase
MKLYYSPGACSLSPHIVLQESGLPYSTVKVDLRQQPHLTEDGVDFSTVNPKGYVPALVLDNGTLLTEGPAIVQYIGDLVPEKKLVPLPGTFERVHLQEWLNFVGTELHKPLGMLWDPGMPADAKAHIRKRLEKRFAWVDQQLTGREYLAGSHFSVADAYLFTVMSWCQYLEIPLDKWPTLQGYLGRVAERPAVQTVLKAEGLTG